MKLNAQHPALQELLRTLTDEAAAIKRVKGIARKIAKEGDHLILEPFFRDRDTAYEMRRLEGVSGQEKWTRYFDHFGCLVCETTDTVHVGCGMCGRCYNRTLARHKQLQGKHYRNLKYREKHGVQIGRHGTTPGTLANLAMHNKRRMGAHLAELGVKPEDAAVRLIDVVEALQKVMPQAEADALTQVELFQKVGVATRTTGRRALAVLLAVKRIERRGEGWSGCPYRYFLAGGNE